jgi:hypothetical protein
MADANDCSHFSRIYFYRCEHLLHNVIAILSGVRRSNLSAHSITRSIVSAHSEIFLGVISAHLQLEANHICPRRATTHFKKDHWLSNIGVLVVEAWAGALHSDCNRAPREILHSNILLPWQ